MGRTTQISAGGSTGMDLTTNTALSGAASGQQARALSMTASAILTSAMTASPALMKALATTISTA